jgi:hypothetical protein
MKNANLAKLNIPDTRPRVETRVSSFCVDNKNQSNT